MSCTGAVDLSGLAEPGEGFGGRAVAGRLLLLSGGTPLCSFSSRMGLRPRRFACGLQ
jgi:hypothetical protein